MTEWEEVGGGPGLRDAHYLPDRRPFLNLSRLDERRLLDVTDELIRQRTESRQHRLFGKTYIAMRRTVEERLFELFVSAGERPERRSPHYIVLGESPCFRGLAVDMQELRLPLTALPAFSSTMNRPCQIP